MPAPTAALSGVRCWPEFQISLAGARFDDIDFSNAVITSNCNFNGMRIAGVDVKELLASYAECQTARQA